jgi:arginyl-tRNA synthetase
MYSIVRAKSILTKIENLNNLKIKNSDKLDNIEKIIINEINKYPLIVKQAQENDNPATLVEFILNLSRYYNSYYNSHRIID